MTHILYFNIYYKINYITLVIIFVFI